MMTNVLIDTNVLIYSYDRESSFYDTARSILNNPDYILFITTKNISEFFAVCSKLDIPFHSSFSYYNDLLRNSTILYPTKRSLSIFEELIQKYKPKGNRVYDLEIVSIMVDNKIKNIATFNTKDFLQMGEIQVLELS